MDFQVQRRNFQIRGVGRGGKTTKNNHSRSQTFSGTIQDPQPFKCSFYNVYWYSPMKKLLKTIGNNNTFVPQITDNTERLRRGMSDRLRTDVKMS